MRSEDELEVGDLVALRSTGPVGTVISKTQEHCSNQGPQLDILYEVYFNIRGESQILSLRYYQLEILQEAPS